MWSSPPEKSPQPPPYAPPSPPAARAPAELTPDQRASVACIIFSSNDLVRVHRFPFGIEQVVRGVILDRWPKGIQKERMADGGFEFKLKGTPWSSGKTQTQHLILAMIAALSKNGWQLVAAPNLVCKENAKDSLLFRRGPPRTGSRTSSFCSLMFSGSSHVSLVNGSEAANRAFLAFCNGISKQNVQYAAVCVRLRGSPWEDKEVLVRLLVCDLITALHGAGCELVTAVNIAVPGGAEMMVEGLFSASDWGVDEEERAMDVLIFVQ